MELSINEKLARVREVFQIPGGVGSADLLEIRGVGDEVVFIVRVGSTPWLYGIPVDLADTSRDYYGYPKESFEEWLDELTTDLMVAVNTGITYWAARVDHDEYVELRFSPKWPRDRRHHLSAAWPVDDPASGWQEGNGLGRIASVEDHVRPDDWWVSPAVSRLVLVNLFRVLMVDAARRGVREVTTTCDAPELDCLGFVWDGDLRRGDTRLLQVDREAAEVLYREGLDRPLPRYRRRGFVVVDHDDPDALKGFYAG